MLKSVLYVVFSKNVIFSFSLSF